MNIGILSMQRVINYGSFLQGYALKNYLRDRDHEVSFIDIKPGEQILGDTRIRENEGIIQKIKQKLDGDLFKKAIRYNLVRERKRRFEEEFFPILGVAEIDYSTDYDAVVIGSDEVFNCTQPAPWGFAKTLLGEGIDSDIILSYAASCGFTTLERVEELNIKDQVEKALSNFDAFSVRDANTRKFVESLTDKEVYDHIDPTLIYTFEKELKNVTIDEKDYILIYAYDDRISDKNVIKETKEFAKKNDLTIISAGVFQAWADKNIVCTPFELLAYFKNATYILTDTFHGTVFSIKSKVPFATIFRDSNNQKLTDLLNKFDLVYRKVNNYTDISKILKMDIDKENIDEKISEYTEKANQYFSKYLDRK